MWADGLVDEVRGAGAARAARRADGQPGARLPAGAAPTSPASCTEAAGARRDGRGPPAGSSAGSAPGSAATRGSRWLDGAARRPGRPALALRRCGDDGTAMKFAKGHGTGNDFVILPDPTARSTLTPGAGRGAVRPAPRHRRRRRAAGGPRAEHPEAPARRRGRVVHGLPERRRLARRDVRQRRPGLRPLPARRRAGRAGRRGLPVATRAGVVRARGRAASTIAVEMRRARVLRHGDAPTVGGLTLPGTAVDVRQPAPGLRAAGRLRWPRST